MFLKLYSSCFILRLILTLEVYMFDNIKLALPDSILGLNDSFKQEKNPNKINLGVGVYKDEQGNTPVLSVVKEAEKLLLTEEYTKSYLPISGSLEYCEKVKMLIFGEKHWVITDNKAATVQSIGGTGALRIAADFIKKFFPKAKVWVSNPTWENHINLFSDVGLQTETYPYYDNSVNWLNFEKLTSTLIKIPAGDVVVFHACCHNPTGIDFTKEQWEQISEIAKKQSFLPLFDFAYQGFGNGLIDDARAIDVFAKKIPNFMIANSFSKNFGLYNERIGALTVVAESTKQMERVLSQLKICIRRSYSNPPVHGAAIINKILSVPAFKTKWENELAEMRDRIKIYRNLLVETLKAKGVEKDFSFIKKQKGMFSYTSLTNKQVQKLRSKYAIYMVDSGRINLAGINKNNIERLCDAIADVLM